MQIFDLLPLGKAQAIPSKQLAEMAGFTTIRALQAAIEKERRAGAVILSTTVESGGYFTSNDPKEISAFIRTLNRRAKHTRESTISAEIALDTITGQARVDGFC